MTTQELEEEVARLRKMAMDFESLASSYKFKYFEASRLLQQTQIALDGYEAENRMLKREIQVLREKLEKYKARCGDID
jgi:chromosome segregation ATPase